MAENPPRSAATFGDLSRRISGWTTNLLVVGVILTIGLALGWQLTGWWRESAAPPLTPARDLAANLPAIENEREFWTSGGLLKIQRQAGNPDDVLGAMRAFCRQPAETLTPREIRSGEANFVSTLLDTTPLEEAGPLALYQPPGQAAMIVAIDRPARRIVAWSIATPADDGQWSLYHFRPK